MELSPQRSFPSFRQYVHGLKYPFTSYLSCTPRKIAFDNIVRKGKCVGNQHNLPFSLGFLLDALTNFVV